MGRRLIADDVNGSHTQRYQLTAPPVQCNKKKKKRKKEEEEEEKKSNQSFCQNDGHVLVVPGNPRVGLIIRFIIAAILADIKDVEGGAETRRN